MILLLVILLILFAVFDVLVQWWALRIGKIVKTIEEQLLNPEDDSALGRRITAHQVAYNKRVGKIL